jgi:UDP-N-acetylmuramoyl-L-alanyl-D-glutamate--2,6-diaminopimelate ligase
VRWLPTQGSTASRILRGDRGDVVFVTGVVYDSRRVEPGSLFCCLRGERSDGHEFAADAVAAGATALLVDHGATPAVPQVVVPMREPRWGWLAAAFFGHPSRVADDRRCHRHQRQDHHHQLIAARAAKHRHAAPRCHRHALGKHTTPEAPDRCRRTLAGFLDAGKRRGGDGGLVARARAGRVDGTHFDVAVFTNLGRDHLDLHGTVERYFAAKALLFEPSLRAACINTDDVHGRLLFDAAPIPMTLLGRRRVDLVVTPTWHTYTWRGQQRAVVGHRRRVQRDEQPRCGHGVRGARRAEPAVVARALSTAAAVPGRFEPVRRRPAVRGDRRLRAHPDGLREACCLRATTSAGAGGRVIVVFGCGGDRDREKRPEMGAVAAELADHVVVTSDNPRSEDPLAIINAIIRGCPRLPWPCCDRARPTPPSPRRSRAPAPGDVVVIAGKGHETTQTIGSNVVPFDDRAVARDLLADLLEAVVIAVMIAGAVAMLVSLFVTRYLITFFRDARPASRSSARTTTVRSTT